MHFFISSNSRNCISSNWTHPSGPCWSHATSIKLPLSHTVSLLWSLMIPIPYNSPHVLSSYSLLYCKCIQEMLIKCLTSTRCLAKHGEYHVELDKSRHYPYFFKYFLFPIIQLRSWWLHLHIYSAAWHRPTGHWCSVLFVLFFQAFLFSFIQ